MTNYTYTTVMIGDREITVRKRAVEAQPKADYSNMTKAELITLAEQRDLEVSSRMTKAKLITALEGDS
jgi:hypothetical protein